MCSADLADEDTRERWERECAEQIKDDADEARVEAYLASREAA